MDVHLAPGQPPRVTAPDDLRRFQVVVAAERSALPQLAEALRGVLEFEGDGHAWVLVNWLLDASGRAGSEEWRSGFDAMMAYAARHGWTRKDPPALRGHIVWQDQAAPG